LATWLVPPIVLFIDRGFEMAPFESALAGRLDCRERVDERDRARVAALVTGLVPVGAAEADRHPGLRLVVSCGIGTDHLDLDELARRGIVVCNTPTYCTDEVADHALACLLAGWRGLWRLDAHVRGGGWDCNAIGFLRRFDESRLGIIGLGRIGRAVARRARALGVEVVAHDPLAPPVAGVERVGLDELLRSCDAVSLHLPATPGAPPLIGVPQLALMRRGALLLNLSRASLVDHEAMLAALRDGRLGGVAVDVWPVEPPAPADDHLRVPGLLVTPHAAWSSERADQAYRDEALASLRAALLEQREPPGRVV
jgi:phosphoglycerate dehydrogenase-like enzyme